MRAVKLLDAVSDPEAAERFQREVHALARLGGGVVPVHDAGSDGGRFWFAMDLMPGGTLTARLAKGGALPWREAAGLALALARTLERAHAQGLVHRDLKPDNVLFDEERRPRIADFGCVRDLSAPRLTATGAMIGTPAYMAPEQLEGGAVDARADIFSLGAVLFEAVTGTRLHEGKQPWEIFEAAKKENRPRASELVAAPPEVDAVIDRALRADPEARYASAADLARDLEALLAKKPLAAKPGAARRGPAAGAALLVGLLLAASAVAALERHRFLASPALDAAAGDGAAAGTAAVPTRSEPVRGETRPAGPPAAALSGKGRVPVSELERLAAQDPERAAKIALERGIDGDALTPSLLGSWRRSGSALARAIAVVDSLDAVLGDKQHVKDFELAFDDSNEEKFIDTPGTLWKALEAIPGIERTYPALIAPIVSPLVSVTRQILFKLVNPTDVSKTRRRLEVVSSELGNVPGLPPTIPAALSVLTESPDAIDAAAKRLASVDPLAAGYLEQHAVELALQGGRRGGREAWSPERAATTLAAVQKATQELLDSEMNKDRDEFSAMVRLKIATDNLDAESASEERKRELLGNACAVALTNGDAGLVKDSMSQFLRLLIKQQRPTDLDEWVGRTIPNMRGREVAVGVLADLERTLEGKEREMARHYLEVARRGRVEGAPPPPAHPGGGAK
jgi:hypothetical protein